jgi:hypothetical protein
MTIAAGFPCKEGLVLCADTQEVISGYVKTDTEKMTVIQGAKWNVFITGAGDSDSIELAVQEITHDLMKVRPPQTLQVAIKKTLHEVFIDTIQPYANFPIEDRPSATLLIGVQSEGVVSMYKSHGLVFRRIDTSECVGMGIALGKSLTAQFFRKDLTLKRAGLIAIYILHQVKRWVDGCGGNSDIILIGRHNLTWARLPTENVESLEKHFDQFFEYLLPILIGAADSSITETDFDKLVNKFSKLDMLGLRGKFMGTDEFFKRISEATGIKFDLTDESPLV